MKKTKTLVGMGILTAIVIVLSVAVAIKFGMFSITLTLVPIVIGAALYGWKAGAWLGFVFGCMALTDAAPFLAVSIPGTVVTCIAKGTLAGAAAGLIYNAIAKKNRLAAVIGAAVTAPIVNTGVFLLGCTAFFLDTIAGWAGSQSVGVYMITGLVGVNFLVEMAVNVVLITAVERILNIVSPNKPKTAAENNKIEENNEVEA